MKIEQLALRQIRLPLVHFFETSFSRTYEREIIIVEVKSEGLSGWGEITAGEHPFYNEEWTAAAWLIARDLDLRSIWFHELRYEGSPGLWHTILWVAQHVFHARYDALGFIGMAGATAGVALVEVPVTLTSPTFSAIPPCSALRRPRFTTPTLALAVVPGAEVSQLSRLPSGL